MSKLTIASAVAIAVIALGAAKCAYGAEPTTFATINEAAVNALQFAYNVSHYYEVGGVITKIGGRYAMGLPVTDFSGDSIANIDFDPYDYHGEIVGSYHTHPCNTNTHIPHLFSPADMHSDRSHHAVGFMADLCTGKVAKYDPTVDVLTKDEIHSGWQGPIVGQFTVDGVVLDEHTSEIL